MFLKYLLILAMTVGVPTTVMAAGSSSSSSSTSNASSYATAEKAVKAGKYKKAVKLLNKEVKRDANNADAWNYLGFSNRKLKKYDASLAAYKKALAINPKHRGANEYLGELYLQTDKVANAKTQLATLKKICRSGCEEYDDLKQAIAVYEVNHGS
jgi:tetratricopeptide (TPR) repeat protein